MRRCDRYCVGWGNIYGFVVDIVHRPHTVVHIPSIRRWTQMFLPQYLEAGCLWSTRGTLSLLARHGVATVPANTRPTPPVFTES